MHLSPSAVDNAIRLLPSSRRLKGRGKYWRRGVPLLGKSPAMSKLSGGVSGTTFATTSYVPRDERVREFPEIPRDQLMPGASSLCRFLQGAAGSRKFVVDLPANRLGPGWKRRLGNASPRPERRSWRRAHAFYDNPTYATRGDLSSSAAVDCGLDGVSQQLRAALQHELLLNAFAMGLDSLDAEEEFLSNLVSGAASAQQRQNLQFTISKSGAQDWTGGRGRDEFLQEPRRKRFAEIQLSGEYPSRIAVTTSFGCCCFMM